MLRKFLRAFSGILSLFLLLFVSNVFTGNFTGILSTIYTFRLILIPLIILLIYNAFKPQIKGYLGEKAVYRCLKKLDPNEYKILNNVLIPSSNGNTTQIDHIVISLYGIFVIETKNYTGWIYGNENCEYWTQVIYKRKEKLFNPIKQNKGHVKALREILSEYKEIPIYPIVAFSPRADLRITVESEVVHTYMLFEVIKRYQMQIISHKDTENIYKRISVVRMMDKRSMKDHIKRVNEKKDSINLEKCPLCGGSLIARAGRYGAFKGCSNYPKCRYTSKL